MTLDEAPLFIPPSDTGVHALKIHLHALQSFRSYP
jgi:hypothetical protein